MEPTVGGEPSPTPKRHLWAGLDFKTTDDRGKPFPVVPVEQAIETVQTELPQSLAFSLWKVVASCAGFLWLGYLALVFATNKFSFQSLVGTGIGLGLMMLMGIAIPRILAKRSKGRGVPPPLPPNVAWLAAHRRCGICGYNLVGISPAGDGCAVCPECGAAWHRDRWALQGREFDKNWWLTGGTRAGVFSGPFEIASDDRGLRLDKALSFGSCLESDSVAPGLRATLLDMDRVVRARSFRIVCAVCVPIWICAVALYATLHQANPRDRLNDVVLVTVVSGLIVLVLLAAAGRLGIGARRVRSLLLSFGVCPNCYRSLSSPVPMPTFDGCTACGHCGRAWDASTIPRVETPS